MTWEDNLKAAQGWLSGQPDYALPVPAFADKADLILAQWPTLKRGEDPFDRFIHPTSAPKTNAFARAIAGDTNAVVIDRHMIDMAYDQYQALRGHINYKQYVELATAFREAAATHKTAPAIAQSITWHHWRESKKQHIHYAQTRLIIDPAKERNATQRTNRHSLPRDPRRLSGTQPKQARPTAVM
jgi:hypothetical protein